MNLILVTGKSGSGKSTFAKKLAEILGYTYIDVDKVAHSIYDNKMMLAKVEQLFGKGIYDSTGLFDRKALGKIVFSKKGSKEVEEFNKLTWQYMKSEIDTKLTDGTVLDYIFLPKTEYWEQNCCKILVESENDTLRFEKIKQRDNVTIEYIQNRESSGINYNKTDFDIVVQNDYSQKTMQANVEDVAKKIKDKITIKFLGVQSPFSDKFSACPSYLISYGATKILLDCGSGSHRFFDMKDLNGLNIFISHLHRDHYNDIFNYQYSSYSLNRLGRVKNKLNIYLPEFKSFVAQDIVNEPNSYANYYELDESKKYNIGKFKIEFCEVKHSKQVKTYAIKLTFGKKKIVYSADLSFADKDKLATFANSADVLICEASLLKEHGFAEICDHLTSYQAGLIAKQAGVKKLLLTHFWAEEDTKKYLKEAKQNFENSIIGKEEKEIYLF